MNFYPKIYETAPLFKNNSSGPINFIILPYFSNNQIPFYSLVPVILIFCLLFSSGSKKFKIDLEGQNYVHFEVILSRNVKIFGITASL